MPDNSSIAESLDMTEGETTTTTATTLPDQGDDNTIATSSWSGLLLTSLAGMAVLVLFMFIVGTLLYRCYQSHVRQKQLVLSRPSRIEGQEELPTAHAVLVRSDGDDDGRNGHPIPMADAVPF
jgi:hypothetical protein